VGGGYPEPESGLSKIALDWMLQEAKWAGLRVDPTKEDEVLGRTESSASVRPNPVADRHESLKGAWRIAEFIPKRHYNWKTGRWEHRMNLFRRRTMPPGSLVHECAFQRGADYQEMLPPGAVSVTTRR